MLCALLFGALLPAAPAAASTISVGDVQVTETANAVNASFTLTRSASLLSSATTVSYRTVDGTATSPADYVATSGTRMFAPELLGGRQIEQVNVAIQGDTLGEAKESFRLVISGAEVSDGEGTATIADDDPEPAISVADAAAVSEGAAGARASFVVRLSAPSGRDVAVGYATSDGSAKAGQDYSALSGRVVIRAGSSQTALDVPVLNDALKEPVETFGLRFSSPVGATLGDAVATATIVDDDDSSAPQPAPADPKPAAPGGTAQAPAPAPAPALPVLPTTTPGANPLLGLSSPRLKRPATVLVTASCPRSAGGCSVRLTIFSVANRRSRIKALRKQRRLGQRTFTLQAGRSRPLALALGKADRMLLARTGRLRVRAHAVTRDSAGRSGMRSVSGTLIARTAHTSPSR